MESRKSANALLILSLLLFFFSCEKTLEQPDTDPKSIQLSLKSAEILQRSNDFGVNFFVKTASGECQNFMLSPLSASVALTMALNGSQANTYLEIKHMLGYQEQYELEDINHAYQTLVNQLLNADTRVKIALANAMFYDHTFNPRPSYINTLRTSFLAQVGELDFDQNSSVSTINKWAADNTFQKIPKVIDRIPRETVMFLMNALYFKGDWSQKFDKQQTTLRPFTLDDQSVVQANTMSGKVNAMTFETESYGVLELPYGRKNFSMVILMPQQSLKDFYLKLNPTTWQSITSTLDNQNGWQETKVIMPTFNIEYEKTLNDVLKEMGMLDAFSPVQADFSEISDEDLFISFVKQNTFIDVNEEGTEAAAVTTIAFNRTSIDNDPIFIVDKPFVFAIRERTTNTLLFIGSVMNPLE